MNIIGTAKKYLIGMAFAGALLVSSGLAQAATCTDVDPGVGVVDISLNVIGTLSGSNSGCELGSDDNDNVGGGTMDVNTDSMFNFTDWIFAGRDNTAGSPAVLGDQDITTAIDIDLVLSTSVLSGTWSINSSIFSLYEMVMIVFKDGNANSGAMPPNYVGYLFDVFDGTSGTYTTPFSNSSNGNPKGISHVSVYVRDPGCTANCAPTEVIPLPGGILLLLSALGGLGFLARSRKAAA